MMHFAVEFKRAQKLRKETRIWYTLTKFYSRYTWQKSLMSPPKVQRRLKHHFPTPKYHLTFVQSLPNFYTKYYTTVGTCTSFQIPAISVGTNPIVLFHCVLKWLLPWDILPSFLEHCSTHNERSVYLFIKLSIQYSKCFGCAGKSCNCPVNSRKWQYYLGGSHRIIGGILQHCS